MTPFDDPKPTPSAVRTAKEFMSSPGLKARCSGPLLTTGYGLNGPGERGLAEVVAEMAARKEAADEIFRGARPLASWTQRDAKRPKGSFSYSFHFAAEAEQEFLAPFRDRYRLT